MVKVDVQGHCERSEAISIFRKVEIATAFFKGLAMTEVRYEL